MMTPLGWFLLTALVWCLALAGYAIVYRPADAQISRFELRVHAIVLVAIVAVEVFWFLGVSRFGSPRIDVKRQRRIEHRGFYSGPAGRFSFAGVPRAQQFPASALQKGEMISFRPVTAEKPSSVPATAKEVKSNLLPQWTVSYRCWRYPLRLGGEVRNVNDDWWLAPGDDVEARVGDHFFTMRVVVEKRTLGLDQQRVVVAFGANGTAAPFRTDEIVVWRRRIREGITLGALLRRAPAEAVGASLQIPSKVLQLADTVTLVRERMGDPSSRLGLLLDVHDIAGAKILKRGIEISPPVKQLRVEQAAAAGTTLSYGLGYSDLFGIILPREITDSDELGPVVLAHFATPQWWPLPPEPSKQFLISSRQEDSPSDGYWIDTGSAERAFYAKATLQQDFSSVLLNTGSVIRPYALDESFLLGDRSHGAIAAVAEARQSVPYAGMIALAVLALFAAAIFLLLPPDDQTLGTRMSVAYLVVWELTLIILSVRLIVGFRTSLLPPADPQVARLFAETLSVSLAAFIVIPLALLVPLVVRRLADIVSPSWVLPDFWIWIGPALLAGYVLVAYLGGRESLLMRVNHVAVAGTLILLALSARQWMEIDSAWRRFAFGALLLVPLALNMTLLGDRGLYVYALAFLVVFVLQTMFNRSHEAGWRLRIALIAVVIFLTVVPLAFTWTGRVLLRHRQIGPDTETLYYRLIAQSAAENAVMAQEVGDTPISGQLLLRNIHQNWQMLLYSTFGSRTPVGYGGAPLTNRGMSYPVVLTDALFSQLIVAEHGPGAALLLTAAYVLFAIVCLHAALFLPDIARHRALPLTAAAVLFGLTALYMASGNVGLAVFTGLNLPLLGLYSWADVVLGGVVAMTVAFALTWQVYTSHTSPIDDRPLLVTMLRSGMAGVGIWLVVLCLALLKLRSTDAQHHLADYRLDAKLLADLHLHFNPPADKNPCWIRKSGTLRYELAPGCSPAVLEQLAIKEYNERPDKSDRRGGLLYLENNRIAINENYFTMTSPFRPQDLWSGRVLTDETSGDVGLVLLGRPVRLALAPGGAASSVFLESPAAMRAGSSVLIAERESQPRLCEVARVSSSEAWIASKHAEGWQIFVDGLNIDGENVEPGRGCGPAPHSRGCRRLLAGDVIVLERRIQRRLDRRYTLLFLGNQPTPVVFTKWVNGGYRHILPQHALAALGYSLAYAIDRIPAAKRPHDITISLDSKLHANLQTAIARYARSTSFYRSADPRDGNRLAVAVIDAYSGRVLALPAWPPVNPRSDNFEKRLETAPTGDQYRLLQNSNYVNHAVGSTIKPLIFSSVATALAPRYQLERLVVFNRSDALTGPPPDPPPVHPHTRLAGLSLVDYWDCHSPDASIDARTFLVRSRNYYEAVIGMIGLLGQPEEWDQVMRSDAHPDVRYGTQNLTFDVTRLNNYAMTLENPSFARTESMKRSLLFRTLPRLFSVHVAGDPSSAYRTECHDYLPTLCSSAATPLATSTLRFSTPEPVMIEPQDFQELGRDYVRGFLVGGRLSRWNNVTMAESMARLVTGQEVRTQIESRHPTAATTFPSLPQPVSVKAWRTANLIEPMGDVVDDVTGTAEKLSAIVPPAFRVIAKTGTIDEGARGRESEMLAAVIGAQTDGEFTPGRTIALYMYMEQSKAKTREMSKFILAREVLQTVSTHLSTRTSATGTPLPESPTTDEEPEQEATAPPISVLPTPPTDDRSGLEGVLERTIQGVVAISTDDGFGTGFFVQGCNIVTNFHVIDGATRIDVVTHDGARRRAVVVRHNAQKDLALLRVAVSQCVALPLEGNRAHLGEDVFAIGNPLGFSETVSRGIVSAVRHLGHANVIQVDAAVNPGNSGGPLINRQGRVLGVTTYQMADAENINFAIAISEVQNALGLQTP
jgi:S1-C subfamily serine protease